jgi:hypothetical protein
MLSGFSEFLRDTGCTGQAVEERTKLGGLGQTIAQDFQPERGAKMKVKTTVKSGSGIWGWG